MWQKKVGIALEHRTPKTQINLTEKAISGCKTVAFNMGNILFLHVNAKVWISGVLDYQCEKTSVVDYFGAVSSMLTFYIQKFSVCRVGLLTNTKRRFESSHFLRLNFQSWWVQYLTMCKLLWEIPMEETYWDTETFKIREYELPIPWEKSGCPISSH